MDVTPSTRPDRPLGPRPRWRRTVARIAAVVAATTAAAVVATGAFGPTSQPAAADGLRAFDGCAEVQDWYVDALRPLVGPYGVGGGYGIASVTDAAGGAERAAGGPLAAASGLQSGAVGNGATGTNLQEAGVDEPDLMKTRDGLLVTTSGDRLVVLDAAGERPRELGSLQVEGLGAGWGGGGPWGVTDDSAAQPGSAELLLDGDRVVLLSSGWAGTEGESTTAQDAQRSSWPGPVGSATTATTVVDVSDPSEPRLVSRQEVEGTLVGARLSEGVVRVVTTSTPALPGAEPRFLPDGNLDPTWEGEATAANLLALEQMSGEDLLPATIERDADGTVTGTTPAVGCADLAHPAAAAGAGTVLVRSLDLGRDDDPVVDSTAVSADGDLVYASADRLYVATTRGGRSRWAGGTVVDGVDVGEVTTELHGFATDQEATTSYVASGEVEGFLLGRWAMSAQDGLLRVATTVGQVWGPVEGQDASESFVTVLAEQDGALVQEGRVGGLGEGETIRAVRWFGDRATVVTFRQTDPLYVVDLSDPTAPAVTGELKVPGYSAYLHPVGDDRLVGIGQDATDEGRTTGVLVQTFDVSDPAAPTQVDTWTQENTWTSVEQDSRQFSYLPDQRLAIMPMETMDGSAVQAFSVDEDGIIDAAGTYRAGSHQQWTSVLRAMPVGGSVAVLTSGEQGGVVTMLDLDGLSATGSVALD